MKRNIEIKINLDTYKVFLAIVVFFFCFFLTAYYAASIITFKDTNAATDVAVVVNGSGYYINATSASEGTVQLDVASTPSGAMALAKDSINVKSNSPDGYKVYVAMARDDSCTTGCNSLYKDKGAATEASISATAGTFDHPQTIGSNSWGFAIDKTMIGAPENDFSTDYNISVPDQTTLWAAMPLKGQDQLIQTIDHPNDTDGIDAEIYYGIKTNTSVTPGIYSGTIIYTIVGSTAGEESELTDVAPSTTYNLEGGETMTITTAYTITPEQAGTVDVTIGGKACTDVTLSQGTDGNLVISCKSPAQTAGKYAVVVSIPSYSKEVTLVNAVEYAVDTVNANVMQNVATWDAPAAGATISKLSYPAGYYDAGTYDIDLGGASASNVLAGVSFSSNTTGINQTGTMPSYQAQYDTSKTAAQNTADAGLTWNADKTSLTIAEGYHTAQTVSNQKIYANVVCSVTVNMTLWSQSQWAAYGTDTTYYTMKTNTGSASRVITVNSSNNSASLNNTGSATIKGTGTDGRDARYRANGGISGMSIGSVSCSYN